VAKFLKGFVIFQVYLAFSLWTHTWNAIGPTKFREFSIVTRLGIDKSIDISYICSIYNYLGLFMAQTSLLQIRVDTELKREAEHLFTDLGIDTPSAVRMFLKQAVIQNGFPFALYRSAENQTKPRLWDSPDSFLNNPVHAGANYRKFTREELHQRGEDKPRPWESPIATPK
jgi:addiction module RelB/DinJ family antitoxin